MPANENQPLTPAGKNFWTLRYPLRFYGMQIGRRVCIMRTGSGQLFIHSSGPFSADTVRRIAQLGQPKALIDATTMHDTFSREARLAFPEIQYLVPQGFPEKAAGADAQCISILDTLSSSEVQTKRIAGTRFLNEHACFHPASRTLILCDLLFNLADASGWTRWAMRHLMGVKRWPAIDRPVQLAVKDRAAFTESLDSILAWDFDRIVVAHGAIIESNGQALFRGAAKRAGFVLS